ncbi:hypothetical protein JOF29_006476 [Kribbella aluminosa]|uniref:Uncharacterized protein n=1 Tax=Kribbella aluminosa TaxID=416017 RepID=A0ABS4UUR8_9ACTN|nr:hypothetical protein [Kribbella aluminosa]MBP2355366.1 hypothetical protein [Kribbella aluminosa]
MLERLIAARWDDQEAEDLHQTSRGALASEFFRRKAVWANALGITKLWPLAEVALAFDPSIETDPLWLERLETAVGHELMPQVRRVVTDMFRWASLGNGPKERFPDFDDPYEPMAQLLERGGQFWPGQGGIDLPIATASYGSLSKRLAQAPIPIDAEALAVLDERDRIELEKIRARAAARRAAEAAGQEPGGSGDSA